MFIARAAAGRTRAVNQQQWPAGPNRTDLRAILRALSALKDHIKATINANLASWNAGHEKANDGFAI